MHTHLKHLTYKMYLTSGVILLALLLGIWLFSNSFLSIKVAPNDATVTVDGEAVSLNSFGIGKKRLPVSYHTIKVEAEGYVSYINTAKFKRGFTTGKKINLREIPESTTISDGGKFITKGSAENEFFYLGNNDSTIYRAKIELNDKGEASLSQYAVTRPELFGINDIVWSPKKDLALFKKEDGVYLFDFNKYDFVNQTETLWGENIGSITWSPDNSKIAYYYAPGNGEKSIIFSSLDGKTKQRIINLTDHGIENPTLRWSSDSEWLLVTPKNKSLSSNKIYLLNAYSKEFKAVTKDGNKINAIFSKDDSKIIFSSDIRTSSSQISATGKDGSSVSILNLHADLNTVYFLNQNEILASRTNDYGSSIFKFDLNGNVEKDFEINFSDGSGIRTILANKDGKVIIYENDFGIYAIPISKLVVS